MNAGRGSHGVDGGLVVLGRPSWAELRRRLPRLVVGILVLGIGVAATVRAELGISPYDVLHQGIAQVTGIDFGVVVIGLGLLILLLWFPLGQPFGVGTVANVLTVGLVIDAALRVIPHVEPLAVRIPLQVTTVSYAFDDAARALTDLAHDRITGAAVLHVDDSNC